MNRKKGYQLLILMLIFAFFSLISRSIIYFLIAGTVVAIIIFLLSSDKNQRQAGRKATEQSNQGKQESKGRSGLILPIGFTILGVVMAAYGLTGVNEVDTIFMKMDLMVKEPFVLYSSVVIGFLLAFYGLVQTIKIMLE